MDTEITQNKDSMIATSTTKHHEVNDDNSASYIHPISWIKTDIMIIFKTILTVIKCNG